MKNASTELASLELVDRLLNQLNDHKVPINLHLNLPKAFDIISHVILLDKLTYNRVKNASSQFLKIYFANRSQYLQIDDEMPSLQKVKSGIPQGFIVGPLFFSIYINNIVKCTDKFNCILYADNTTLNSTIDSFEQEIDTIQRNMSKELQNLCKWLDSNRLHLNIAKSKFILFHMPQKLCQNYNSNFMGR